MVELVKAGYIEIIATFNSKVIKFARLNLKPQVFFLKERIN